MADEQDFALLGTRPCGCATCVVLDKPQYVEAEEILKWIHAGLIVQRIPADVARERIVKEFMQCPHSEI